MARTRSCSEEEKDPSCGGAGEASVTPGAAAFVKYLQTDGFGAEKMVYLTRAYRNYKGDKDGYRKVSKFIHSLEECPSFVFYTSDDKPSVKPARPGDAHGLVDRAPQVGVPTSCAMSDVYVCIGSGSDAVLRGRSRSPRLIFQCSDCGEKFPNTPGTIGISERWDCDLCGEGVVTCHPVRRPPADVEAPEAREAASRGRSRTRRRGVQPCTPRRSPEAASAAHSRATDAIAIAAQRPRRGVGAPEAREDDDEEPLVLYRLDPLHLDGGRKRMALPNGMVLPNGKL